MPELPDIDAYLCALDARIAGRTLEKVRVASAFVLRTVEPPIARVEGQLIRELRRIGKRVAIGLDNDLWAVVHLMIAGRLHWRASGVKLAGRNNLAAFDFSAGSLLLTEAGTKRRASLHIVSGESGIAQHGSWRHRDFLQQLEEFRAALMAENRTLKRALTDPRIFSGIGNAYSDEILHAAQLSPIALTRKLNADEWQSAVFGNAGTLELWISSSAKPGGSRVSGKGHRFPTTTWRFTGGSARLALDAAITFSESATPTMKQITARAARPAADCWRTAPCRACSEPTGREHWMNWRRSGGAKDLGAETNCAYRRASNQSTIARGTVLRALLLTYMPMWPTSTARSS